MASIVSKVKKATTNYAKNVVGGAKIVGSAVSNAVKKVSGTSQSGAVLNATAIPGAITKALAPKSPEVMINVGGKNLTGAGVAASGMSTKDFSIALANQNKGATSFKGFGGGKSGGSGTSASFSSSRQSIPVAGSTNILASDALTPGQFGATSFSQTSTNRNSSSPSLPTTNVVNNSALRSTSPITLPEPTVQDYSASIPPITASDPTALDTATKEKDTAFTDYLKSLTKNEPNSADAYTKAQRETDILRKQNEVNDLTGKLNAIVNQGQANQLAQVGQGRGIPEAIIGGIQAQIGRETAIAALPVQAQLSAAQGNLEMANQNLETLFKIYSDDAKNNYEHRLAVKKAVYEYATDKEKKLLEQQNKLEERAYAEKKSNLAMLSEWQKTALATGQKSLFTKMSQINPSSPTFTQDLAKLQVQIVSSIKTPEAPTIKTINGVDLQWDSASGQWISPTGANSSVGGADKAQQAKDQLSFLRDTAKQASALANASGPSFISRTLGDTFVGDTEYRQLESLTNTLKTNMLTLATDPTIKKFFGPQMSNADVLLMTSAGTTLNPQANSPTQMLNEIQRLDNLFNRMQTAVSGGGVSGGNIVTAPTGEQINIID